MTSQSSVGVNAIASGHGAQPLVPHNTLALTGNFNTLHND